MQSYNICPMSGLSHLAQCLCSSYMSLQMAGFASFSWLYNIPLCIYTTVFSFIDTHLGGFHILCIVNNAVVNMGEQASFWCPVSVSFGYKTRSGTARSYDSFYF